MLGIHTKYRKKFDPSLALDSLDYPLGKNVKLMRYSFNVIAKGFNGDLFSIRLTLILKFQEIIIFNREIFSTEIKKVFNFKVITPDSTKPKFNEYVMKNEDQKELDTLLMIYKLTFVSLHGIR
jgi:hypothetical protein